MPDLHTAVRSDQTGAAALGASRRAYAVRLPAGAACIDDAVGDAAALGFDSVLAWAATGDDPAADAQGDAIAALARAARRAGLQVWSVISPSQLHSSHDLPRLLAPGAFTLPPLLAGTVIDPRQPMPRGEGIVRLRHVADAAVQDWWRERIEWLHGLGVAGVALVDVHAPGERFADWLRSIGEPVKLLSTAKPLLGAQPGADVLLGADQDYSGLRDDLARAAMTARGWALAAGAERDVEAAVRKVNRAIGKRAHDETVRARIWTGRGARLRVASVSSQDGALVMVENTGTAPVLLPPQSLPALPWQSLTPASGFSTDGLLHPGRVALFDAAEQPACTNGKRLKLADAVDPARRVTVLGFTPSVDNGAWPAKATIGETICVHADIFADGHEQLAAEVLTRGVGETAWAAHPMRAGANDVWLADIRFTRLGLQEITVQAWIDEWGGFVRDLARKLEAGQNVALEVREAQLMLEEAAARAEPDVAHTLRDALAALAHGDAAAQTRVLLDDGIRAAMARADERRFLAQGFVQPVRVEREAARFASWYEIFPRSMAEHEGGHGTFADVRRILPHVAGMGFDTLYFTPIHPIGVRNRKGKNNTTVAEPGDVGSPYAIGSAEGGHMEVHPQLGTLQEFLDLQQEARRHGLELALDFAIQCAPDHPWLQQHPGWFAWRPDGSIKYAENPPKKYQDIVNVDFYAKAAVPSLWKALRDVVLHWASHGVRVFRVDNPHTKPLPFWAWMIEAVQARYPDAIFLSEAFTRPKPMYQLAKAGFSQSYTYFTWRNEKAELINYLTELTETPVRDFFRPHFFVNTPDINPLFLQTSGRAGFLIRAALAATLSGLWGVYAGFELCEAAALPGREEYLDSEKYQVRQRPWRAAGDIVDEITKLNQLRRSEPALQTHLGVSFHTMNNDRIIYYSKAAPGHADRVLVAVSLDPHQTQEGAFEVPLWLFGMADWETVQVEDMLTDVAFTWTGKWRHVRLTPDHPYAIWRISPRQAS